MTDTAPEPTTPEPELAVDLEATPLDPEPDLAVAPPDPDEENRIFAACQAKQDEIVAAEAVVQTLRDELAQLHDQLQAHQETLKATTPPPAPFRDERSN